MRLRLLPPSSYGFRRLAKVLALVAFLVNIGYWVHDTEKTETSFIHIDAERSVRQENLCTEDHTRTPSETRTCIDDADKTLSRRYVVTSPLWETWREILVTLIIFTICGVFWSFVVALIVRTMGFIALGFTRPAQP